MRHDLIYGIASVSSFLFALLVGLTGFGRPNLLPEILCDPKAHAAQQSDSVRSDELRKLIEEEIGTPTAKEASQCKLIPFGSKPCGGPGKYLVYSTAKTNETRLKQLVSEFNQLGKKMNEERKIPSDCMFVTEPSVELVGGICTIKSN
jgi:hypothetical protein